MGRELPPVVWFVPWLGLLLLPPLGEGPVGERLAVLFAELLLGLPALLATPALLRSNLLPIQPTSSLLVQGVLWGLPIAIAHAGLSMASQWLWPLPLEMEQLLRATLLPHGALQVLLTGGTLLVVAPVMEEIFFRGVMRHLWGERLRRGRLWGPALLFALAHGNPWSLPVLFLLGLTLGWLRERTGSLVPGILAHAAVNALGWCWLLGDWPTP